MSKVKVGNRNYLSFLRNFRATLHPTTGVSVALLLLKGRQVHSRLPEITILYNDNMVLESKMLIKNERSSIMQIRN